MIAPNHPNPAKPAGLLGSYPRGQERGLADSDRYEREFPIEGVGAWATEVLVSTENL